MLRPCAELPRRGSLSHLLLRAASTAASSAPAPSSSAAATNAVSISSSSSCCSPSLFTSSSSSSSSRSTAPVAAASSGSSSYPSSSSSSSPSPSHWARPDPQQGQRRSFFWSGKPQGNLLGIEGLQAAADFPRLAVIAVEEAKGELASVSDKTAEEIVTALDNASNCLCRIADAAEMVRNVHPDPKYVSKANQAVQGVAGYMGEVNINRPLYEGMLRSEKEASFEKLDEEARVVLKHMRVSMEHEGVHLGEQEKEYCLKLLEADQQLAFDIVQRQEALRQDVEGREQDGGAWISLDAAKECLAPVLTRLKTKNVSGGQQVWIPADSAYAHQVLRTSSCPNTRREVFDSQHSDALGDQQMAMLLATRQQLARVRGYATWNDYAGREAIVRKPNDFLKAAWERMRPGVEADLRQLRADKQRLGLGDGKLAAWDMQILMNRSRQEHSMEDSTIAQYLTYGSMMNGVDLIANKLLGLNFQMEKPHDGEVWHQSVQKYTFRDQDEVAGVLYMDPFARAGKTMSSAQFTLQGSKVLRDGSRQTPKTSLVYALSPDAPTLPLQHAVIFMHEIGHAVHSLLSQSRYQHLSGTRGTVDFVEFPSHLFEHFVQDASCLSKYARNMQGEYMPEEVQKRCRRNRLRYAHYEAVQQLVYAAVDQAFYSYHPFDHFAPDEDPALMAEGVKGQIQEALSIFDNDIDTGSFSGSFTELLGLSKGANFDHLVHYGGSYYCYLFNRALSAHVWQKSFQEDPFAPSVGEPLRNMLQGGSVVQSMDVIQALLPPNERGFRPEEVPLDAFINMISVE